MDTNKQGSSPLISAEDLKSCLNNPDIVLLDCTWYLPSQNRDARKEYLECRIPGARYFDIDAIKDHANPLPHMLPGSAEFSEAARSLGISNTTRVIVYDNNSYMASARVWWTFRIFGHLKISVLNGGLARWLQLQQPVATGEPEAITTRVPEYQTVYQPELVQNLRQMLGHVESGSIQILDARSPGRFHGTEPEPRPNLRSGHIPGSKNLFFKQLLNELNGTFKPGELLEQEFRNAGIDPKRPVITSCGTGVTAAILALGLYCLGNHTAALYDGSWTEWGGSSDTPVDKSP